MISIIKNFMMIFLLLSKIEIKSISGLENKRIKIAVKKTFIGANLIFLFSLLIAELLIIINMNFLYLVIMTFSNALLNIITLCFVLNIILKHLNNDKFEKYSDYFNFN